MAVAAIVTGAVGYGRFLVVRTSASVYLEQNWIRNVSLRFILPTLQKLTKIKKKLISSPSIPLSKTLLVLTNEQLGMVWNARWQSFVALGAFFEGPKWGVNALSKFQNIPLQLFRAVKNVQNCPYNRGLVKISSAELSNWTFIFSGFQFGTLHDFTDKQKVTKNEKRSRKLRKQQTHKEHERRAKDKMWN